MCLMNKLADSEWLTYNSYCPGCYFPFCNIKVFNSFAFLLTEHAGVNLA